MYMLRLRRREVRVSSTLLWQQLARDREANAPWQKLKRNLLLILQLIILGLLVFALARPFLPVPSVVNNSVVVLLDGSASMQATDEEPNRFEVAKLEVEELISALGSNQMTIIQVGPTPRVLAAATSDRTQLRESLLQAQPSNATADWAAAFALASGAAQGFQDARIIIVSDGGLPEGLPALPSETVYIPVGQSSSNLALTALATRNTETGVQLFASVRNEGVLDRSALLSITIDGSLFDAKQIDIPAQETVNFTWQLSDATAVVEAALSNNEGDALALDDRAITVHEGGVSNRALIVTEGNLFLEQIYTVLPSIEAFKAPPDSDLTSPDVEPFDLYIFDGVALPDPPPAADILIINPVQSNFINVTGIISDTSQTAATRLAPSPLLQFVDWSGVNIRQFKQIDVPWARPLVEASAGPLILTGEQNGHRIAIITFDLRDSDLPLQIAFPILMANLTNWLNPGQAFNVSGSLQPEDVVTLVPSASATAVQITKPDGTIWETPVNESGDLFFTETEQLGLYQVALTDNTGTQPAGSFAINLFSPAESVITPRENLVLGSQSLQTTADDDVGQWEFWPWLAAVAFIILLAEWWVYHRGTRLPSFGSINVEPLLQRLRGR